MNEPQISVTGNATADAELHFTANGKSVASFTVAATPRIKKGDAYEDGEPLFFRVSVWDQMAENVAASVTKGSRVTVIGGLRKEVYQDKDGNDRESLEIVYASVALDLRFHQGQLQKAQQGGGGQRPAQQQQRPQQAQQAPQGGADDETPW